MRCLPPGFQKTAMDKMSRISAEWIRRQMRGARLRYSGGRASGSVYSPVGAGCWSLCVANSRESLAGSLGSERKRRPQIEQAYSPVQMRLPSQFAITALRQTFWAAILKSYIDDSSKTARGKKERRMAESHAPPLQINQLFVYLRDHLLLASFRDTLIIKPFGRVFNRGVVVDLLQDPLGANDGVLDRRTRCRRQSLVKSKSG